MIYIFLKPNLHQPLIISTIEVAVGVLAGARPDLPADIPSPLAELIQRCWDTNPTKRPTAEEALTELKAVAQLIQIQLEPQIVNQNQLQDKVLSCVKEGQSFVVRRNWPSHSQSYLQVKEANYRKQSKESGKCIWSEKEVVSFLQTVFLTGRL